MANNKENNISEKKVSKDSVAKKNIKVGNKKIDSSKSVSEKKEVKTTNKSNNKEQVKKVSNRKKISESKKKEIKPNMKKDTDSKLITLEEVEQKIDDKLKETKKIEILKNDNNIKEEKISFSLFEVILLIIITILSCILVGYFIKPSTYELPDADVNDIADETTKDEVEFFLEQYNYILNNYYGDIDKEQLMKDAIEGMFSSLDDYSQVIDQESNSFTVTLEGEYEGVGIAISNDLFGNIVIQEVYEDTPAYNAGFTAGDIIIKFNDESLTGVTTMELVEKIANSNEMELTVLHGEETITKTIKREKIVLKSVRSEMLENKIGYIDVDIFANNTLEQFKTALEDLEDKNMKSLIIDLRDNTGGHLTAVEQMLYLFLDKDHIIYQTEDKSGIEKFYSKGNKDKKYKIVILQNGSSASASEIMASALKDELGAYIIGTTSFGKGTVQTLKSVNEDLQYKFTIKRWLTPKGTWINGVGITPDLEVELSEEYYLNPIPENDNQLKTAIDYLKK